MKLALKNINGKDVGEVLVPKSFIESKTSSSVVRQAVLAEMVNLRQGTHSSKNRSSVRGGGKKPGSKKEEVGKSWNNSISIMERWRCCFWP